MRPDPFLKIFFERGGEVDCYWVVQVKEAEETPSVVAMNVREYYDLDLVGVNFEGRHVGKKGLGISTGIEQDCPFPHFHQIGEPPGCVQAIVVQVVIVEDSKVDSFSSENCPT
jgi:hypothetical protein